MSDLSRQKQAHFHAPHRGIQGDCYRTAVACVLGVERDTVPHSHDEQTGEESAAFMDAWLKRHGLHRIWMPVGGDDFRTVANNLYPRGNGLSCIITGEGPRSVNHVIVVHGVDDFWCPTLGQVSADVALIGPALPDGYFWVEWIVARAALPAVNALIEEAVQATIDAGLAVNGEYGVAAARHAARYALSALVSAPADPAPAPAADVVEARRADVLIAALEFYANPAVYAPHPHGPAFDRRDISFKAKNALAEFRGVE